MPSVQFSVWRFEEDSKEGVEVGTAIRTEVTGKAAWNLACKDVASVIAGDCRRRGNPSSYGIAMTFRVRNDTLPETAAIAESDVKQLEILPEIPAKVTPARKERGQRKRGA